MRTPYLLEFPKPGNSEIGYISVAEQQYVPFDVKRVFWTYYTPERIVRGRHARHYLAEQAKHYLASKGPYAPAKLWYAFKKTNNPKVGLLAGLGFEYEVVKNRQKYKARF